MAKKGILVLMMLALVMLVGCEEGDPRFNEVIDQDWVQDGSYWEDDNGNSFAYMYDESEDNYWIDIHCMDGGNDYLCYIDEFNYENGQVVGTYTYHDPVDGESTLRGPFSVTITFSYASETLTVNYSGPGTLHDVLDGVTMNLHLPPPPEL
jgi:hypothetical protein